MTAFRATILCIAGLPLAALASPATAQIDDAIVLDILRQCARVDDASARLACYDNNVRVDNASVARPPRVPASTPRQQAQPQGGDRIAAPNNGATGFGREDVRGPERFETPAGEIDELTARVSAVEELNQGTYIITLEDGAQWQFAETVDFAYRPPRVGSTVSIDRGAIGSFLMVFDSQRSVRVRRLR